MIASRPLHSREELINVLRGRCPYTACERALDSGEVVVLGGFTPSEDFDFSYWTVQITSRHGKEWLLTVEPSLTGYKVREIKQVEWQEWAGDPKGIPSIYNGDRPIYFGGIKSATIGRAEHVEDSAASKD
jgi:hypothetical protein